jgi:putative oxidoreductase
MEAHTPAPLKVLHHPDLGLLLIRIGIAAVGVFHGGQKVFGWWGGGSVAKFAEGLSDKVPLPMASAWAAALSEFAGGILIGLGLFSRVAAFFFGFTMLVAWGMAHNFSFLKANNGSDFPFVLMMVAAGLILTGPGKFSINALIFGPKPKTA